MRCQGSARRRGSRHRVGTLRLVERAVRTWRNSRSASRRSPTCRSARPPARSSRGRCWGATTSTSGTRRHPRDRRADARRGRRRRGRRRGGRAAGSGGRRSDVARTRPGQLPGRVPDRDPDGAGRAGAGGAHRVSRSRCSTRRRSSSWAAAACSASTPAAPNRRRMVKLSYRPEGAASGHLGLVGKGIMYDSGGISLKPADASAPPDEERHVRRRRDPRRDVRAARPRLPGRGHRLAHVHRQHAVRLGDQARRRAHDPRRHDGRGHQHRRRGPAGDGRRARARGRGRRRRDRRHRHPDRRSACGPSGTEIAGVFGNDHGLVDQVQAAADATDEPVWQLPLAQPVPQAARLRRSPTSRTWAAPNAGSITAALFLAEFVGDDPVGAHRHRRHGAGRRRAYVAEQGLHRLRHAAAHRARADFATPSPDEPTRQGREARGRRRWPTTSDDARKRRRAGRSRTFDAADARRDREGSATRSRTRRSSSLGLIVLVIVLSAVLALFDVSVTYEVAEQPPVVVEERPTGRHAGARAGRPARGLRRRRLRDRTARRPRSRAC